jgi:hypothetical protein
MKLATMALEPAKVIAGRVTYGDTGKPVAHAAIEIVAYRGGAGYSNEYETDVEGRFRANPFSADRYAVSVHAPVGQPYLNTWTGAFAWPKGALEHRVDVSLQRGTMIRGKVTEANSGGPIAGAMLAFFGRPRTGGEPGPWSSHTQTGPDGSYLLAAALKVGAGTLIVHGPSDDYVLQCDGRANDARGPAGRCALVRSQVHPLQSQAGS